MRKLECPVVKYIGWPFQIDVGSNPTISTLKALIQAEFLEHMKPIGLIVFYTTYLNIVVAQLVEQSCQKEQVYLD